MTELSKSRYMMNVSNCLSGIRYKIQQTAFLKYTYLIFLAGFFLSPSNHLHRNFFYLFVIAPFLIGLDSNLIHNCIKSKLFKLSILFLLYFWASMFWTDTNLSSEEYYDQTRYLLMLALFIMATILISSKSKKFFDQIKFWLCLVAVASAICFIIIFYSSHAFAQIRLSGPFDYTHNPNQAAMHFGFVAIIAFYSSISSKIKWHKIFFSSVLFVTLGFVFLCESRGPLLAIFCSIALGLIFEKRWKTISIAIIICIGLIFLFETFNIGSESFIERGFTHRIDLWLNALKRISQAPFLGEGYFTDVYIKIEGEILSPHNLLLLVMVKSGIVGGGAFLVLILTVFGHSYKFFKISDNWIYLCLFVYFVVCMTFDSVHILYKPSLAWLIFWLPVGLIAGEEIRLKILPQDYRSDSLIQN